ncbi:MAG: redox-regulated ATPase YchF [Gammaproteobacteria bacterium]|nr:MAG: redox-regulated ATPase YchF [Gammaproteobacteria bacterium]
MGIKCGIVGLPNVGKSTLFNALTASEVAAENFPFCTIDSNIGIVNVPDPRLLAVAEIVQAKRVIPTVVEFVDIAGLVKGASTGEGLGNRFLAHIRETHAIAHLVRCFSSDDITHVSGQIDPIEDIEVVNTELLLADLESVERAFEKAARQAKTNQKDAVIWRDLLRRILDSLEAGTPVRAMEFQPQEYGLLQDIHLITAKPVMYLANVAEGEPTDNPYLESVRAYAEQEGAPVVAICAALEAELAQLDPAEQGEFLCELGLTEPGLNRVIAATYNLLTLQTFYTASEQEARAWTVPRGATAYDAAGEIHTDFQKGFIRAEVIAYDRFIARRGEQGAKEAGEMRLEGKTYILADGDVVHFRFNV